MLWLELWEEPELRCCALSRLSFCDLHGFLGLSGPSPSSGCKAVWSTSRRSEAQPQRSCTLAGACGPALATPPTPIMAALDQVVSLLAAGDFYSAHQKARTTAARLLAGPRRATAAPTTATATFDKKAQDAAELLWETARRLLEEGQVGSGADLAIMLVGVWDARGVACGDQQRGEQPS